MAFLVVLAACMGHSPATEVTPTPVPATSDPGSARHHTGSPGHRRVQCGYHLAVTGLIFGNINSHTHPGASFAFGNP